MRFAWRLAWLCGLALTAFGCGSKHPATYPVAGEVVYQGQPVAGADISLTPQTAQPGTRPAHGRTDEQGRFSVRTYFGPGDDVPGALPGPYVVTVTKIETPPGPIDPERSSPPKNLLPNQYADPLQSKLTANVTEQPGNVLQLKLD